MFMARWRRWHQGFGSAEILWSQLELGFYQDLYFRIFYMKIDASSFIKNIKATNDDNNIYLGLVVRDCWAMDFFWIFLFATSRPSREWLGLPFLPPRVCVGDEPNNSVCARTLLKEDCIFQEKVKDVLTYIWKTILKTLNVLEDGFT
jgi:hypothetical protein